MSDHHRALGVSDVEVEALRKSGEFDEKWYVSEYPDVAKTGLDPALHYLWIGRAMQRQPRGPSVESIPRDINEIITTEARYRLDRNAPISSSEDWLVFVAYSADGALSDCQRHQIETFVAASYRVALVINTDALLDMVDPRCDVASIIVVRENLGFDFGAWSHAVKTLGGLANARSVSFTNDSIVPVDSHFDTVREVRLRVDECAADVIFLTENQEVRPHHQSYFFTFKSSALLRNSLDLIAEVPCYRSKDALIYNVELYLSERMAQAGLSVAALFELGVEENPTIHHWEALLDNGFPYLKVQLVTAGILPIEDMRLTARMDTSIHAALRDHCAVRVSSTTAPLPDLSAGPKQALPISGLFNEYGAQQAINPAPALFPTIRVPLSGDAEPVSPAPHILAIIHGYYTDVLPAIFGQIAALGIEIFVVVTTDTAEKMEETRALLAAKGLTGEVVLCRNRGRDVAPFLIEGSPYIEHYDIVLHLHTKKSPHDSVYAGWGEYLRANLIGSREIVLSILKIITQSPIGLVYSDHFPAVNGLRNWGFDWDHASRLLSRIGCEIDADTPLEFPTSTMFWARRDAIKPLFDLGLSYEDFEEEAGQVDGTLAHAIERSLLYVAEHAGFSHAKVTAQELPTDPGAALMSLRPDSVSYALDRPMPRLNGGLTLKSEYYRSVPEIYPVGFARSTNPRLRLNAILPTMKPEKIYGGITTALGVVRKISDEFECECDLRVLIVSDSVDYASIEALGSRLGRTFSRATPLDDVAGDTIVGIAEAQNTPISLRAGEMYIATAWWTADLGFRMIDQQTKIFGSNPAMTYIIQDFEPGFYKWSNQYALADATYRRPEQTIALLNSEELAGYVSARYRFLDQQLVPYALHPVLESLIEPRLPDKLVLAYGRPSVERNCFELLREGLRIWQARSPRENTQYSLVFAGEEFDQDLLTGLENAQTVGKMSIEEYAEMLNRACVGVSLMVSPHPSYPPLEMASAGCMTVTNSYEGKDLTRRSDCIISTDVMTPDALADAIEVAMRKVDFSKKKRVSKIRDLDIDMPSVDYGSISDLMLARARNY